MEIPEKLNQIILGSLLGDGCIPKPCSKTNKTARLQILHSTKQEAYCKYKYDLVKEFDLVNSLCYSTVKDKRFEDKLYYQVKFRTKTKALFAPYYKEFYRTGKKKVPKDLIQSLDALGLAIWYMDDGTKCKFNYMICTQGFDKESVLILTELLKSK